MGNKLSGYESIRIVRLLLRDRSIQNLTQNLSSDLSSQNLEELNIKNSDSDQQTIIQVPANKLEGDIVLTRQYNMLDELSLTVRADYLTARVEGATADDPYYPLVDPYLINKLEIDVILGYKQLYPDKLIRFRGLLTSMAPQFLPDGRILSNLIFYDKGFDMCRTVRQHCYPSLDNNIDKIDPNNELATQPEIRNETIDESPEEFLNRTRGGGLISQKMAQPFDRSWSIRGERETISLYQIIKNIIEGDNSTGSTVGGYGFMLEINDQIKSDLNEIKYSHTNPIRQDNQTDWEFLRVELDNRGYTIVRFIENSTYTISIEGRDSSLENATEERFRLVLNRPGQKLTDFNPFLLADNAAGSAALDAPKKAKQNVNVSDRLVTGFHNFIIQGDLSINIETTGLYSPSFRTYVDDKGKPHIVSTEKNSSGDTIEVEYEINEELVDQASGEGQGLEYLRGLALGTYTFEDARNDGFIVRAINRDSNDTNNEGFKSFPRAGWSCSVQTIGNPYALVGKWYWINGIGANYLQRWELRTCTHTFSHKWTTSYELSR